jgi:integrase/recombinase XerD
LQIGTKAIHTASSAQISDPSGFRDGLCVALLAAMPVRIGNFATLRIGHHLIQQGAGWGVSLSAAETKTRKPDSWPVPAALNPSIQRYLGEIRPALLARGRKTPTTDRLWIGSGGGPVDQQTVRHWIERVTEEALGVAITPHRFRHAAATTYTLERPSSAVDAAALLGHTSPATTEKHYIIQQRLLVQEDYLGLLRLRQSTASSSENSSSI